MRNALVAAALLVVCACARLAERPVLPTQAAISGIDYGALHEHAQRIGARLDAEASAYWLLDRNSLALDARLALLDSAAAALDIQYFIWQEDVTGKLLAARLLDAADRGVAIRLLLDDFGVASSRSDIVHLDEHPTIEVRLFNPWARRESRITKTVEFLFRFRALNRRMHNKTWIADHHFAIVGGRNIGDRYFGLYERFVQNDLDVLVAGPLVADVSASFDAYWNSPNSYPLSALRDSGDATESLPETRARLAAAVATEADVLREFPLEAGDWRAFLEELVESAALGDGELYFDTPEIGQPAQRRLYPRFKDLIAGAQREVLISSPYFIPDEEFSDLLRDCVARGVRVAIVTNSLASNNHTVAHTGYRRWRRTVLNAGVELYELRSDAAAVELYVTPPVETDALGLHTKAVVVDGARTFIGSPNVDPRSMVLNTEIGVVAESPELARRVRALIERDMAPENSWRVTMDGEGWLAWSNGEQTLRRQPARNFMQRAIEFLLNLVPLKKQV